MADNDEISVTKESLWYIDNYVLIRDYYDRTVSRIAARCIRMGNIAVEDYPFYPYIIDVLNELCETGDYIIEHKDHVLTAGIKVTSISTSLLRSRFAGVAALEKNLSLYKQELERNSSVDMAAKKEADLSAAKDAFGGFTDQSDDPTKGAGQSIDDVVAKLMAEQEKIIQKKEENDE